MTRQTLTTPVLGCALAALAAVAITAPTRDAHADVIVKGYVVRLEAGEMYFDIGRGSGLQPGGLLRVKRPIQLRHPVSGKLVDDDLPLGQITVAVVGDALSMAVPDNELLYPVQVGDLVEAYIVRTEEAPKVAKPKPKPKQPPKPLPPEEQEPPLPAIDAPTARILAVWEATAGMPIDGRIAAWEAYLSEHPDSPYAANVKAELELLHTYREQFAAEDAGRAATEPTVGGIEHRAPTQWRHHLSMGLAFAAADPGHISAAWIHYRKRGSDTYRKRELARDGDGYLRARLDADDAEGPGVEYFVEVLTDGGLVGSAVGTPEQPISVEIEAPKVNQIFVEKKHRSRVSITTAYLDFATFDKRTIPMTTDARPFEDTMMVFEADFFYRLRTFLYGMRMGGGVMNGKGGYGNGNPDLDAEGDPRTRAFNYGYTELEFRATKNVSLLTRGIVGVGTNGLGGGLEGRVRLGQEDETNLMFGVSSLTEIGFLTELKLHWTAFPRFPLGLGIGLTNQPNPDGDLAVRFTADIGLRTWSWFQPTVQVSYQGRTVAHSGLGAGLGMVFDW